MHVTKEQLSPPMPVQRWAMAHGDAAAAELQGWAAGSTALQT